MSDQNLVLELPHNIAVRSAAAMLAGTGKPNPKLPYTGVAQFDGEALYATDRYIAARFELPSSGSPDDRFVLGDGFFIPHAALVWATKTKPLHLKKVPRIADVQDDGYTIRYSRDEEDNVTVQLRDTFNQVEVESIFPVDYVGNYPPVHKLFDTKYDDLDEGTTYNFGPSQLARVFTFAARHPARYSKGAIGLQVASHGTMRLSFDGAEFLVARAGS